jgi:MSHA biogenesis protein MshJ
MMSQLYSKFSKYLKTLTLREKVLMLFVGIAIMYATWDAVFFGIFNKSHQQYVSQIDDVENELLNVDRQLKELTSQFIAAGNPNERLKLAITESNQHLQELEQALSTTFESLVPPTEVTSFIRSLLLENSGMKLIALNNEPVEVIKLNLPSEDESQQNDSARLYQHATNIKLTGDYVSLYNYLIELEQSEWTLYWDQLQYQVTTYPNAEIMLRIYTLSTDEHWLGL